MILIQNGRVLDPVTNTDQVLDVLLDESGIMKTGEHLEAEGADVIDASGLVVAPGLMDAHVHFPGSGSDLQRGHFHRSGGSGKRRIYDSRVHGKYETDG